MNRIDWYQVKIGGCPALLKTLQEWEGHCRAEHCELVDMLAAVAQRVQVLEERLAAVEHLVGQELLGGIVRPAEMREAVAELGHGWRIEHLPSATPPPPTQAGTAGILGESWIPAGQYDWVAAYAAAAK